MFTSVLFNKFLYPPGSNLKIGVAMPEFLVPSKYKSIFNEYDLSVIKADHRPAERSDLSLYRREFIERVRSRYPNPKWLPPPLFETISKIEKLTDEEFSELMGCFRFV